MQIENEIAEIESYDLFEVIVSGTICDAEGDCTSGSKVK